MRVSTLLAGLASLALVKGADRKFTFKNNCKQTIWPGFQDSSAKKLIDAEGSDKVMGFMLKEGGERTIPVPDTWSGRMWGRTDCKNKDGQFKCATGNCEGTDENCITGNQLATIAEFTLQKPDADGPDNYDLSLVDGFNLQMQIKPNKGCQELSCTTDINAICPKELQKDGGCVTACKAGISEGIYRNATGDFPGNRNCCTGPFAIPEYCSVEMNDYYWLFKDACPKAYAYAYDDHKSLVTCDQKQQADYTITFCPTDAPSSAATKAAHSSDQWLATQVCVPPTWTWLSWASENKIDKEPVTNVCERAKKNEAEPLDGEHTRSEGPAASSTSDFASTSNPGGPAHNPAATKTGASKDTKAPAKTGAPPVPSKTGETKDSEGPAKTGLPSLQPDAFSGSKSAPVETVDESAGSGLTPMPTRTPSASDGPASTLHPAASSNNPPASGLPGANLKLPIPIPTTGATDSEDHEGINLGAIPNDKPSCKRNKKRGMKKRLLESRQKESL